MHFPILRSRQILAASAIALAVGACSTGIQPGAGGSVGDLTLSIASPANGAEVSVPFDVRLESNVMLGPPESGNHHAHLYFDTSTDAADYDIAYGNSWHVTRALSPGKHTIIAALANPDHSLAGPTQTITVTVTGSGSGGGSGAPPASATPGDSY